MAKKLLKERFQELAGIKPLYELEKNEGIFDKVKKAFTKDKPEEEKPTKRVWKGSKEDGYWDDERGRAEKRMEDAGKKILALGLEIGKCSTGDSWRTCKIKMGDTDGDQYTEKSRLLKNPYAGFAKIGGKIVDPKTGQPFDPQPDVSKLKAMNL